MIEISETQGQRGSLARGRSESPVEQRLVESEAAIPSCCLDYGDYGETDASGRGRLLFEVCQRKQRLIVEC